MSILRLRSDACSIPVADGTVQCVVTSPPYYGLRRYDGPQDRAWPDGWRGALGHEPTVDLYVAHLVAAMREVRRVLRDDGVCWLNLGDSYGRPATRTRANGAAAGKHGYSGALPGDGEDKRLLGVPWRVAFALQADGWILRTDIVWHKVAPMPESVAGVRWERHRVKVARAEVGRDGLNGSGRRSHGASIAEPSRTETWPDRPQQGHAAGATRADFAPRALWADCPGCPQCAATDGLVLRRGSWRPTRAHEFVFLFAKSPSYFCDGEAVKEPSVADHGSGNGYRRAARESFRDDDGPRGSGEPWMPQATRNLRDVWTLGPEPYAGAHFATFPTELARRCILAGTPEGGCCARCGAARARIVARGTGEARVFGHRPTCTCAAPTVPAIVLDPFGGSGTTARVAVELRRRAVLCDLSRSYLADLAGERTRGVQVVMEGCA